MNKKIKSKLESLEKQTGINLKNVFPIDTVYDRINSLVSITNVLSRFLLPFLIIFLAALFGGIIMYFAVKSAGLLIFFICIAVYILITIGLIIGVKNIVKGTINDITKISEYSLFMIKTILEKFKDKDVQSNILVQLTMYQLVMPVTEKVVKEKLTVFKSLIFKIIESSLFRLTEMVLKQIHSKEIHFENYDNIIKNITKMMLAIEKISKQTVKGFSIVLNVVLSLLLFIVAPPAIVFIVLIILDLINKFTV